MMYFIRKFGSMQVLNLYRKHEMVQLVGVDLSSWWSPWIGVICYILPFLILFAKRLMCADTHPTTQKENILRTYMWVFTHTHTHTNTYAIFMLLDAKNIKSKLFILYTPQKYCNCHLKLFHYLRRLGEQKFLNITSKNISSNAVSF